MTVGFGPEAVKRLRRATIAPHRATHSHAAVCASAVRTIAATLGNGDRPYRFAAV